VNSVEAVVVYINLSLHQCQNISFGAYHYIGCCVEIRMHAVAVFFAAHHGPYTLEVPVYN
jgi:hypothetical protein